jgi:hypothetical protein
VALEKIRLTVSIFHGKILSAWLRPVSQIFGHGLNGSMPLLGPVAVKNRYAPWTLAWIASATIHLAVAGAIAVSVVWAPMPDDPQPERVQFEGHWRSLDDDRRMTRWESDGALPADSRSVDSDPQWSEVMETSRTTQSTTIAKSDSESASFLQRQVERSVADGKRRSETDNQDKLTRLSRRLTESSNEENIDRMADFLEGMMGARDEPSELDSPSQPFQFETAQIDRVRKETDSQGDVHYHATLVDAHGAKMELELDSETGASLYKTLKIIESNPLLERVYRRIVMGFLDQMLRQPTKQ